MVTGKDIIQNAWEVHLENRRVVFCIAIVPRLVQHLFVMLIPSPINFFKPGFFRKFRLFRKSRGLERSYSFGFLNGESLEDRTYIIRPTVVAIVPSSSSSGRLIQVSYFFYKNEACYP